jgi:excisionase family DNA binding protein
MSDDRITSTVTQFVRRSGLGRTKVYEMLAAGELESAKLGRTRLVIEGSYLRLLERTRVRPKGKVPDQP